ncbi:snRNA-activating protein complex subunit 1-like [Mugil cephalus]|uniref:snRNA-activating protein complex subunit 1-like n=1 Tax=Mugil cephalus TaxID=48193 RepID=UPI001FB6AF23|nr:snRNA-activating protein complex subunit 1-like [Mugil cephalus]
MPRLPLVYVDFFYGPLTEDVEELLARFQLTDSVRYEDFSAIWRGMGFSDVFVGITSMIEMKRFCRICMATALKYFLPPYSYQIRVGGLYLMFGFYHAQLASPPVTVRLPLKDWPHVQTFLRDTVDSGHLDVVYIFQKLVADKAVHYAAMPHFLTFHKQRKPKKEAVCAEFLGRTTAVHELVSANVVEEVANVQNHYEKLKESTAEVGAHVDMTHRDFASRLRGCMTEFVAWQQKTFSSSQAKKDAVEEEEEDEEEEDNEEESSSRRARLLSAIKQKSYNIYREASKSRRHRQAETVDVCSRGPEQEASGLQRRRPPSLRTRTCQSLGMTEEEEEDNLQSWLLSAPDQRERVPVRRVQNTPPFKP